MLLGKHGADPAHNGRAVREAAHHLGPPADFLVEPLLRVVAPDLAPVLAREGGQGEHVGAGLGEPGGRLREALRELLDHPRC